MSFDSFKIICDNCNTPVDILAVVCPNCGKNLTSVGFDPNIILSDYLPKPATTGMDLILEKNPDEIKQESEKLKERIKFLEEKSKKEVTDLENELDAAQKQTLKMKNALKKLESAYTKESKKPLTNDDTKFPYRIDEKSTFDDKLIKKLRRIRKI